MKLLNYIRITAITIAAAGVLLLVPLTYYQWQGHKVDASPTVPARAALKPSPELITGTPVALDISSLNMHLAIINGYYNSKNGEWTLTLDKAQYATVTVPPNNLSGNTLIYGHYRPEVFAYLHLIKPGAQATITTDNGYVFTYTYQSTEAFDPHDTSIFTYQGAPRLTIQTCSGTFMQHRQMYYFQYNGYRKI